MKERPILFSAPMVQALLAGTKTQTRRAIKLPHQNPLGVWESIDIGGKGCYLDKACTIPDPEVPRTCLWHTRTADMIGCPYGKAGDRLWVRENGWERPERTRKMMREGADIWVRYYYDADGISEQDAADFKGWGFKRRPSIFMPRWASRLTLEVTGIRVERLHDITADDAIAEGIYKPVGSLFWHSGTGLCGATPTDAYRNLWKAINDDASWDANPWVWVVEFKSTNPGTPKDSINRCAS